MNAPAPRGEGNGWEKYADALPAKSRDYYLRQFRRIEAMGPRAISWNWAACFGTFPWLRHRGMRGYSWAYLPLSLPALFFWWFLTQMDRCAPEVVRVGMADALAGLMLAGFVVPPLLANALYFRYVRRKIAAATLSVTEEAERRGAIESRLATRGLLGPLGAMGTIVFVILFAIQAHQGFEMRARVNEVFAAGRVYQLEAAQFFKDKGRLPARVEEVGGFPSGLRCVSRVSIERDGSIRVVAGFPPLSGQSVVFAPTVVGSELSWTCTGGDLPAKYRPANCR